MILFHIPNTYLTHCSFSFADNYGCCLLTVNVYCANCLFSIECKYSSSKRGIYVRLTTITKIWRKSHFLPFYCLVIRNISVFLEDWHLYSFPRYTKWRIVKRINTLVFFWWWKRFESFMKSLPNGITGILRRSKVFRCRILSIKIKMCILVRIVKHMIIMSMIQTFVLPFYLKDSAANEIYLSILISFRLARKTIKITLFLLVNDFFFWFLQKLFLTCSIPTENNVVCPRSHKYTSEFCT